MTSKQQWGPLQLCANHQIGWVCCPRHSSGVWISWDICHHSILSVASQLAAVQRERLFVTILSSENDLSTFPHNGPIVIWVKVKEVWTTIAIYAIAMHCWGYTSLEVKGRWGLLLSPWLLITAVRQPGTSIPVEALLCRCHLDVQGLVHQQLPSSTVVQYGGLLTVDRVVVLPCMLCYIWLIHYLPLTGIPFLQSRLQSQFGLSDVDLATAPGDTIYHIGLLTKR